MSTVTGQAGSGQGTITVVATAISPNGTPIAASQTINVAYSTQNMSSCFSNTIYLTPMQIDAMGACGTGVQYQYYISNNSNNSRQYLYADSQCLNFAERGYYSDGNMYYLVGGIGTIALTGACASLNTGNTTSVTTSILNTSLNTPNSPISTTTSVVGGVTTMGSAPVSVSPTIVYSTPVYGCTDPTALNYDSSATVDDGSCQQEFRRTRSTTTTSVTNTQAVNQPVDFIIPPQIQPGPPQQSTEVPVYVMPTINTATMPSITPIVQPVYGCTDPNAVNYNRFATSDDGSCAYAAAPTSQTTIVSDSSNTILDNIFFA